MTNLKAKLQETIKSLGKTSHVDPEAVKRVKMAIEAAQKESADLKREKG